MSRNGVLTAFFSAVALLAALLGVVHYLRPTGNTVDWVTELRYGEIHDRLGEIERTIDARLARLESRDSSERAIPRSVTGPAPLEVETSPTNESEGASKGFAELAHRLERIEVRLNGLEEDPLRRGYAFLVSESEELRKDGIRSLRRVGRFDPEARAAIRQLLGDPSVGVRIEALDALADLKDKESVPGMLALLSDEDAGVRRRVLEALAECEAREAVPSIARQLALDGDDKVREEAADILGRMRDASASESLVAALKDPNERVRGEAIASLGEIGDRAAQPILREIYEANPGEHRRRLVFALKSLGDGEPLRREVAGITQTLLQSEKEDARREALWLLAKFAGESSRGAIQQAAEADPSPGIRRDAGRILKEWKR